MPVHFATEQQNKTQLTEEFDRQVDNLLQKEYPRLAGMGEREFLNLVEPLKKTIESFSVSDKIAKKGSIPFLIVIKNELVRAESAMSQVKVKDIEGAVNMYPVEPQSFKPIEGWQIPDSATYLLLDIDTGRETLNVTPSDALKLVTRGNRSPLTIDEGIALVTHYPEAIEDKENYNCFYMLGSRRGDKRIPAIWMSYGKPRLGWCWEGNPHTWLGSASCVGRAGTKKL